LFTQPNRTKQRQLPRAGWMGFGWLRPVWMACQLAAAMMILFRVDAALVFSTRLLVILVDGTPALPANSPCTSPRHIFLYR